MVQLLLVIIYMAFISLGLPDSLLGSAWPTMYKEFQVPVSYAGAISMVIAAGTIISSLFSDRLTKKLGVGRVTAISVLMTAVALFGFSFSGSYWMLILWAVPYGLGAGSVDASLNNYVALHYASRHMSWLHCMWGIGASAGPYIMGFALSGGQGWNAGYRYIAIMQMVLTMILMISLPLWNRPKGKVLPDGEITRQEETLTLRQIVRIPGAKAVMTAMFGYCAIEQTVGLWAGSYLVLFKDVSAETAAAFVGVFFIGITIGRAISGFLTIKFSDTQMIRMGEGIIFIGVLALLLPFGEVVSLSGFILVGLGCAPIYPCVIHSTPRHFGADRSQAIIGVQMAGAYVGNCVMPPIFGLIANYINVGLMPVYVLAILVLMILMYERLLVKTRKVNVI